MSVDELSAKVVAWIGAIPDQAMIVTDAPDYDVEMMLKPLLDPWPKNLVRQPAIFDSYAIGADMDSQMWLSQVMADFHTAERPEHHALHDAFALREGMRAARRKGWTPKWR